MKTLIWKELRENLKWAVLAMLVLGGAELKYERDSGAVFVDFPELLQKGKTYSIDASTSSGIPSRRRL